MTIVARISLIFLLAINFVSHAQTTVINYDESADGDLSCASEPFFILGEGTNTFVGTEGGLSGGTNDVDCVNFTIPPGHQLEAVTFRFTSIVDSTDSQSILGRDNWLRTEDFVVLSGASFSTIDPTRYLLNAFDGFDPYSLFVAVLPLSEGNYRYQNGGLFVPGLYTYEIQLSVVDAQAPVVEPVVGFFNTIASNAGAPVVSEQTPVQPLASFSKTVTSGLATSQLDVSISNNVDGSSQITLTNLADVQLGGSGAGVSFAMQFDVLQEATYEIFGGMTGSSIGLPDEFVVQLQTSIQFNDLDPFTVLFFEGDNSAPFGADSMNVDFTWNGVNEGDLGGNVPSSGSLTGVLQPGRHGLDGTATIFSRGGGFTAEAQTEISIRITPTGSVPGAEPPTAEAGPNQAIHVGQQVTLSGNGSFDDLTPTDDLMYAWSFASVPPGSALTALNDATTITPSFTADLPGDYVVSLVVTDQNGLSSVPDTATVSSLNVPPIADAGADQGAIVGDFLTLDGSASSDPDFDPITYSWTLTGLPPASAASITLPNNAFANFVPDLPGIYTAELIVNDGFANSAPDETKITVVTAEAFAEMKAVEAINAIGALPIDSVSTKGNQNAISQHLSQVVSALQIGDIDKAIFKLEEVIERTDGCTLRATPDAGTGPGPQPKKDYVTDCIEQETIYLLLTEALEALSP